MSIIIEENFDSCVEECSRLRLSISWYCVRQETLAEVKEKLGVEFSDKPTLPPAPPVVLIISGPSGVGKDAVIKQLQEVSLLFAPL